MLVVVAIVGIPVGLWLMYRGKAGSSADNAGSAALPVAVPVVATAPPFTPPLPAVRPVVVARPAEEAVRPSAPPPPAAAQPVAVRAGSSTVVPVPGITAEEVRNVLSKGQALEDKGAMLEAGKAYVDAIASCTDERLLAALEERLGKANVGLLLSRQKMPGKVEYVVKANDAVEKIARKNKTTTELVSRINGLGSKGIIRNGQSLTVFTGQWSIAISKSRFELVLELNGAFFKRYEVCVGPGAKTPAGPYVITSREIDPTWWPEGQGPIPPGDKKNPLGTRWMAIKDKQNPAGDKRGLGIHGTTDDSSIGKALSAGCIRMRNSDVEELHMLVPLSTPVVIAE